MDRYFECLEDVWAGRSIEIASRIVRGLYPAGAGPATAGPPDTHPVIVRTDAWLAGHPDAPRALRRIIIEQRSHLHRALTAQALAANPRIDCSVTALLRAQNGSYGAIDGVVGA